MSLLTKIDGIEKVIASGANIGTIKPHLLDLRDHAKALERDITQLEIDHDALEKAVSQLQQEIAGLKAVQAPVQPKISDDAKSLIRLMAEGGGFAYIWTTWRAPLRLTKRQQIILLIISRRRPRRSESLSSNPGLQMETDGLRQGVCGHKWSDWQESTGATEAVVGASIASSCPVLGA